MHCDLQCARTEPVIGGQSPGKNEEEEHTCGQEHEHADDLDHVVFAAARSAGDTGIRKSICVRGRWVLAMPGGDRRRGASRRGFSVHYRRRCRCGLVAPTMPEGVHEYGTQEESTECE